jgi:ABC-type uncharacterized transport system substrate-binding protein
MKFSKFLFCALLIGAFCFSVFAQQKSKAMCIPVDSKIFIADMAEDFHTFMAAALKDVDIKLLVVTDKEKADFEMTGTAKPSQRNSWARVIFAGQTGSKESASITISNLKTSVVVFSAASDRSNARRGTRSVANKMARELRDKLKEDVKLGCALQ